MKGNDGIIYIPNSKAWSIFEMRSLLEVIGYKVKVYNCKYYYIVTYTSLIEEGKRNDDDI